ncbi:CYTH domain-containing protein [Aerococcus agrisoli]|uniref:CYTH domain-containing protein n=1 Tax=Aerococcus agrisoli TaxID=2487350 RepID=A0A3N4H6P9_9LACT|nr:CYTH domain-containing protein [Aerococcus agrisoli]RPA60864.1 CYTH domain-containing protein [Aerococcus agrisoli]
MTKNIEIEYKNLLSEATYNRLFQAFAFDQTPALTQTNIYFDTPDGKLRERHIGLRVRITDTYTHLTMKQPVADHQKLETTDKLTAADAETIVATGKLTNGPEIAKILAEFDIALNDLVIIGQFKTVRHQQTVEGHTMVLDHCYFSAFEDYELEVESHDAESGQAFFQEILQKYEIPQQVVKQKIRRMSQSAADPIIEQA